MQHSPAQLALDAAAVTLRAIWAEMFRRFGLMGVEPARQGATANWCSAIFRKFDRLLTRYRAGKLRRASAVRVCPPGRKVVHKPAFRVSRRYAWLCMTGRHHAAAYGGQLQHLLSQPEMAAFLEAVPQARRILRPLARALAMTLPWVMDKPRGERKPRAHKPKPVYPEDARIRWQRGEKTWTRKDRQMERLLKLKKELVAKIAQERGR